MDLGVSLSFVPRGSVLDARPGTVVLDVGSRCEPGVIDHHLRAVGEECAAALVFDRPRLVLDHLRRHPPAGELAIVLHRDPDLDAVTAAYFTRRLHRSGELPRAWAPLAEYVRDVDAGRCRLTVPLDQQLHGLFLAVTALHLRSLAEMDPHPRDVALVARGFQLLDHVTAHLERGGRLDDGALFAPPHPFGAEQQMAREDQARYRRDLARAEVFTVAVPLAEEDGLRPVDAIRLADPTSIGFRHWARHDAEHSPARRGFCLTHVIYGGDAQPVPPRHVIAVDPESDVCLRGLGLALEWNESVARELERRPRLGRPRWDDVDNDDPWYDGRSPLHHYTIVDAPRGGTLLRPDEVAATLADSAAWSRLVARPKPDERLLCPRGCIRVGGDPHCGRHGDRMLPEDVAGRYTLRSALAFGGFGTVWKAEDRREHRACALKALHWDWQRDETQVLRFLAEGVLGHRIRHDNVVRIYDYGQAPGIGAFLTMELLEGTTLEQVVSRWWAEEGRDFPQRRAARMTLQAALGVQALHDAGLLHRDIKPANIMVGTGTPETVKLVDLGIAAALDPEVTRRTVVGSFTGSPLYMAPERFLGPARQGRPRDLVVQSDVYSLGLVLYGILTGRLPFGANLVTLRGDRWTPGDLAELLVHCAERRQSEAPDPRELRPSLHPELAALVRRSLRLSPEERPARARDLADALAALLPVLPD
jgi:hypothetical protein